MTVRSVVIVVVVVGVAYCALMVGAVAAISWLIAPREYLVDQAVEKQVMKDLEPWSDQVMAVQAPVGTTLTEDSGVLGCLYDDSVQTVHQPEAGIYWDGPYDPAAAENGPGKVARSEFGHLVDRLETIGWRVRSEGLVEGSDEVEPSRMEAVLLRGSGDDLVRLELTTYGWDYGAVLTLPHAPRACRVDVDWP